MNNYNQILYIAMFVRSKQKDQQATLRGITYYDDTSVLPELQSVKGTFHPAKGIFVMDETQKPTIIDKISITNERVVVAVSDPFTYRFLVFDKKDSQGLWYHETDTIYATADIRPIGTLKEGFPRTEVPQDAIDYHVLLTIPLLELLESDTAKEAMSAMSVDTPNLAAVLQKQMGRETFRLNLQGVGLETGNQIIENIEALGFIFPEEKEDRK